LSQQRLDLRRLLPKLLQIIVTQTDPVATHAVFSTPTKTTSRTFAMPHQVHPTLKINRTRPAGATFCSSGLVCTSRASANKTTPAEGGSTDISVSSCGSSVTSGGKL